ncbi:MAG: ASCH domain-containing protein [Proteobacteria bacterium]|nr:ASCH domain-containing protein [Pseudomonadota bacterium]
MTGAITKGLIIDEPWISAILSGRKTWEMRKTNCRLRGDIALIRKGSGLLVGTASVVGCELPLDSLAKYAAAESKHCIPTDRQQKAFSDGWRIPWVLANARTLKNPVRYNHPYGAVIWVNLEPDAIASVNVQV